jgi:O-acetyl-ADP-ribose deacetylase (regulator of RNase III)
MLHSTRVKNSTLTLVQGNIVEMHADAIVNAANQALASGGGVDGAILDAGGPRLLEACRTIGGCRTGSAVVTTAGNLAAQYVFHAVGPIYGYHEDAADLLRSAYQTCLDLADQYHLESIAFPALSTGAFGYPLKEAATIALRTILAHLNNPTSLKQVTMVLFDRSAYQAHTRALERLLSRPGGEPPISSSC